MTLADFQASRKIETAKDFADRIGDTGEVFSADLVHTYHGDLYIEVLPNGEYLLTLYRDSWTSKDLPDLETKLYAFAKDEGIIQ